MIFVNLCVSDIVAATAFYTAIGAKKNETYSNDTTSCSERSSPSSPLCPVNLPKSYLPLQSSSTITNTPSLTQWSSAKPST